MAKNIAANVKDPGPTRFFSSSFRRTLMDHIDIIKSAVSTQPMVYDANAAYHCKGDLYLLFRTIQLAPKYWWITMKVNGYNSPEEFDGEYVNMILPDISYIDNLYRIHNTSEGNV